MGIAAYHALLSFGGSTVVSNDLLRSQQTQLDSLLDENQQLSDDLFQPRLTSLIAPEDLIWPYDESADARADVVAGRKSAVENERFLMITFGANWCHDCRRLYVNLESDEVSAYVDDKFDFVRVDIGKFNRNVELARELGVNLEYGVPVAIFYDRDGNVIGATNEGELEPARLFTSNQILKFVRDVAERSRILGVGGQSWRDANVQRGVAGSGPRRADRAARGRAAEGDGARRLGCGRWPRSCWSAHSAGASSRPA